MYASSNKPVVNPAVKKSEVNILNQLMENYFIFLITQNSKLYGFNTESIITF